MLPTSSRKGNRGFGAIASVCSLFIGLNSITAIAQTVPEPRNLRLGTEGVDTASPEPPPSTATLSYSEGGEISEFSPAALAPDLVRYVDGAAGSNNNDGKTAVTAWQTPSKVTKEAATLPIGAHVLFKRGLEYEGRVEIINTRGGRDSRIVLGSYGPAIASPPRLGKIILKNSSYVTVRDLDALSIILDDGSNNILVYKNIVRGDPVKGYPNNGIQILGDTSYVAVVSNEIYDIGSNDGITVHTDNDKQSPEDHHWIIGNLIIGNEGMEDGIDLAMSEPEYGDAHIAKDVKVVGNKVVMKALAGTSSLSGFGQKALEANHAGENIWVVGNILAGTSGPCVRVGSEKRNVFFGGNIVFGCDQSNDNIRKPSAFFDGTTVTISENTFQHSSAAREIVNLGGTSIAFERNRLSSDRGDAAFFVKLNMPSLSAIQKMDKNVYDYVDAADGRLAFEQVNDGTRISAFSSLKEFQDQTSLEVSGLSEVNSEQPEPSLNPNDWGEQFRKDLAEMYTESSCNLGVGAIDCNGSWRQLRLISMPEIGTGWSGPPIVGKTLEQLGVSY